MINREQLTPLSELSDHKVAADDSDVRGWTVIAADGQSIGTVTDLLIDTTRMKAEYLAVDTEAEGDVFVPAASATLNPERREVRVSDYASERDSRHVTGGTDTVRGYAASSATDERSRLTRAEEEVRIGKREVAAGEVVVAKHVESERVSQDVPVERERVRVERRPVSGEYASGDLGADEIRVPIIQEELVVEKRPVVKEELVISKERVTETERVDTDVRKERFDVSGDTDLVDDDRTGRRSR